MACVRNTLTAPAALPTPTPVPAAPVTFNVSIGNSSASATNYIYTVSGGANGTGGLLTFTAHVGDTVILPSAGIHPLYFDNGSTTCLTVGGNLISGYTSGSVTYTFPATGSYYFHCGFHASGCSPSNGTCGATGCTALAGVATVN